MMFALMKSGEIQKYPYTRQELALNNPNVSFPRNMTPAELAEWGMVHVVAKGQPFSDHTKNVTEGTPVLQDSKWVQVWSVTDATVEEIERRTEQKAASVRSERNSKLAASDWTQLADSTADKAAWATYRQALRDATEQSGFPWTIDWPTQP
jgi:hypothetical protein